MVQNAHFNETKTIVDGSADSVAPLHAEALGGAPAPKREKKNTLLKVTSILLIVLGALSVLLSVVTFAGAEYLVTSESAGTLDGVDLSSAWFIVLTSAVLSLIGGVVSVAAGVLGLRVRKTSRRRQCIEVCQILAIALVGFAFVSVFASGLTSGFNVWLILDFVTSAIFPVLFYVAVRREIRSTFWEGIKSSSDAGEGNDRALHEFDEVAFSFAQADAAHVRLVPLASFAAEHPAIFERAVPAGAIQHSYAFTGERRCFGTLSVPENNGLKASKDPLTCVFLLEEGGLTLATADAGLVQLFREFVNEASSFEPDITAAGFLARFLGFVIRDDALFLHDQEHRLDRLEDTMADSDNEIPADFDEFVTHTRRLLRALHGFYRQLSDMAHSLESASGPDLSPVDSRAFRALAEQARRLADDSHELSEYTLHIRDFYQAKIDVRQNKVMQTLTIVTSIFMPLTLITGWYGMNFELMPELHWSASYFVVIALAITLVTIEVVLFKRKKWF